MTVSPSRVSWLLGSGASIPSKLPCTAELTKLVLQPGRMSLGSTGNYTPIDPNRPSTHWDTDQPERVLKFIQLLENEFRGYFETRKMPFTYEDLYSLAVQIRDSDEEYDNPALQPLIDKIEPQVQPFLGGSISNLNRLTGEACGYIRDTLDHALRKPPVTLKQFRCVTDSFLAQTTKALDVFTLNHDCLFEQWCRQENIRLVDGFEEVPDEDSIRYWNPDTYDQNAQALRLFKLHGSIDWLRVYARNSWWDNFGILGHWETFDQLRRETHDLDQRYTVLIGTVNKILDYSSLLHADLRCQFQHRMRDANILVVCGYGFNDKGINSRIIDWMYLRRADQPANRLVVVDPKFDSLQSQAAITRLWKSWEREERFFLIKDGIENISWPDIRQALESKNSDAVIL